MLAAVTLWAASLAGLASPAAAEPPAPTVTSWAVDGAQVFVDFAYTPTDAESLQGFEVLVEVEGDEPRTEEHPPDTRWFVVFRPHHEPGTPFRLSLRAVESSGPGAWAVFEGRLGGRFPSSPVDLAASSRATEDVLALHWTPVAGHSASAAAAYDDLVEHEVWVVLDSLGRDQHQLLRTDQHDRLVHGAVALGVRLVALVGPHGVRPRGPVAGACLRGGQAPGRRLLHGVEGRATDRVPGLLARRGGR